MRCTRRTVNGVLAVIGGILIHLTYGHYYTITNLLPYMLSYMRTHSDPDVRDGQSIWFSALTLAMEGIAMPLGGYAATKFGYRLVVSLSCIMVSGGIALTYFTIQHSFGTILVTFSIIYGLGFGFGYSVILTVTSSWFPARRGLIFGMVLGGFGLGSLVFTPIQTAFVNPNNVKVNKTAGHFTDPELLNRVPYVFLLMGGILFGIQLVGFLLLRTVPKVNELDALCLQQENQPNRISVTESIETEGGTTEDEAEEEQGKSEEGKSEEGKAKDVANVSGGVNYSIKQVARQLDFYLLWLAMFCTVIPIIIVTSISKLFGQKYMSDDLFLSTVVTISAIFNCGGRVAWGHIVDRFSFKIPICAMFLLWGVFLITFPHLYLVPEDALKPVYALWVFAMYFTISGAFSMMPSATNILFGPKHVAVNYGVIFSSFVAGTLIWAGITSSMVVKDAYFFQFTGSGCACLVGFIIMFWINDRRLRSRYNPRQWCELKFRRRTLQ
ncbi:unnamed protein product [Calicophoron daubneyi]|uniref:Oxalate:formate antiporter n=1 Tax=Calicophoron daubneyi TaxID=300641 RepID=A0AAV2TD91_CALDB